MDQVQQVTAFKLTRDPGFIGGPVVIPNCVEVHIVWALTNGKTGRNILHARVAANFTVTVAIADNLTNALKGALTSSGLAGFLAPTAGLSGVQLRDVRTANLGLVSTGVSGESGTGTGIALPDEVAAVITLRTGLVGPAHRGRMFVPGWASNALGANGVIAATAVTALQAFANDLPGIWTAQAMTLALGLPARAGYTGSTGTVHDPRPAGTLDVTSQVVRDNHWDSMRRRGLH
jgi:hypothetical protein